MHAFVAGPDPGAARASAHSILSQPRFRPERVPHPLTGVLRWIGDRLASVVRPLATLWDHLTDLTTTGIGMVVSATVLVVVIVLITRAVARRRLSRARARVAGGAGMEHTSRDPDELERAADRAERRGDLALAIRLRFRAGLLRLDERGILEYDPSRANGAIARRLHHPVFDRLAREFDLVAYGDHDPSADDVSASRLGWERVLAEVPR
ncbi:MAG: DUF4129 domain-containing protein [Acidimicrobiia bacterium]